ncbi:MAG: lipid-A-disaccharide synthase, partial [Bacteroidales bacterium]|nr:lipid-A-disaccharide synthase [Bacteroidales bacterium]
KYISLVNLILNKEAVKELVAGSFSIHNIQQELQNLLYNLSYREEMMSDYQNVFRKLGEPGAPEHAAEIMIKLLNTKK